MSYKCECGIYIELEKWVLDKNHNNCNYCCWSCESNIDAIVYKLEKYNILYLNFKNRKYIAKYEFKDTNFCYSDTFEFNYSIDDNIDNLPIVINLIKKFKDNLIFM